MELKIQLNGLIEYDTIEYQSYNKWKMKKKNDINDIDLDQIIGYCQQKFVNILPNTGPQTSQVKPTEIVHEADQIRLIMKQLSIFLQLTIQNCVLTSNPKVKSDSYRILGTFGKLLSRDLEDFENLIRHRNKTKLPFFQVDCKDFLGRELSIKIPPQVSLYQDPLLFYNYCRLAQQQLFCNMPIVKTREDRIQIIRRHVPFLDPKYIPIVGERLETKAKFTQLQDRLLLIFLSLHQKKDIGKFKKIYFPHRQEGQIRNRAKNLCAKELTNPVKKLRQNEYLPLTQQQIKTMIKAYKKFGDRWPIISKYYDLRSGELLRGEYENDIKLSRLRKSYNIQIEYGLIKEIIEEEMSKQMEQGGRKQVQNMEMDIEEEDEKMSEDEEPQYKVINHLTFLYEEI